MTILDRQKLEENLIRDEGERLFPYYDTVRKLTIGIGRNLTDRGISQEESRFLLASDIKSHLGELDKSIPWWRGLDEVRQRALANMAFNLGVPTLLTFRNTLVALQNGNWDEAAAHAKNSTWRGQVGLRAERIIHMFRTGTDP